MDELKYNSYIKFGEDTFFKFVKNEISISSGVNQFEYLDLYKELMTIEIINQNSISTYAEPKGNQLLIEALSYYENYLFQKLVCGEKYKLCMVAGATAGLNFIFDYFSMQGFRDGLIIGYSYTLFKMLAQRYGIQLKLVVSEEKNKIIPDISEVVNSIERHQVKFVCLTEPFNPSGEMYNEEDFRKLIKICKRCKCILIIDKCQRDELQIRNRKSYFSINKVICEEDSFDNVVIINSLSKVRSIPGARIGYVMGNEQIIKYMEYMNTITYWHCNSSCSIATAIDVLYQLIFWDSNNIKRYINDFKYMLKYSITNVIIAKKIFEYININTIKQKAEKYCQSIINQYAIIQKNYLYVKEHLDPQKYELTRLDGGFNFCVKFKSSMGEKEFKNYANKKYKLELFTQEDFCCETMDSRYFWLRISCAEMSESFNEKFEILCQILNEVTV